MADAIGGALALVGGDLAGRALGKATAGGPGEGVANNPAPGVPGGVGTAGSTPLDTQAGTIRQNKRNVQAQDLSLFTLSNSNNLLNNNSLLGL